MACNNKHPIFIDDLAVAEPRHGERGWMRLDELDSLDRLDWIIKKKDALMRHPLLG